MSVSSFLHILLVSAAVCVAIISSAPYYNEDEQPDFFLSNKTLDEIYGEVRQCWMNAASSHGNDSADPWKPLHISPTRPAVHVTPDQCAAITTFYSKCRCFKSAYKAQGKTVRVTYYVDIPAFDSDVTYRL